MGADLDRFRPHRPRLGRRVYAIVRSHGSLECGRMRVGAQSMRCRCIVSSGEDGVVCFWSYGGANLASVDVFGSHGLRCLADGDGVSDGAPGVCLL